MSRGPDVPVAEFLSLYAPRTRRLAEAARKAIFKAVPQASERVRLGWQLIGYNAPAYFAFIAPQHDHIKIGFEWGVMLSDPSSLLEGGGNQVRYVTVRSVADIKRPGLMALLRAAAAIVPPPREDRSRR